MQEDPGQEMPRRLSRENVHGIKMRGAFLEQNMTDEMPRRRSSFQSNRRESLRNSTGLTLAVLKEHERNLYPEKRERHLSLKSTSQSDGQGFDIRNGHRGSLSSNRQPSITESSYENLHDDKSSQRTSFYGAAMSIRALRVTRRLSVTSIPFPRPSISIPLDRPLKFENTYIMDIKEENRFKVEQVKAIVDQMLHSTLEGMKYNAENCKHLCVSLSDLIKSRVKQLNMPRYHLVCFVVIGQKDGQGASFASRCLWNADTDNYATVTYESPSLVANATIYGIYLD